MMIMLEIAAKSSLNLDYDPTPLAFSLQSNLKLIYNNSITSSGLVSWSLVCRFVSGVGCQANTGTELRTFTIRVDWSRVKRSDLLKNTTHHPV